MEESAQLVKAKQLLTCKLGGIGHKFPAHVIEKFNPKVPLECPSFYEGFTNQGMKIVKFEKGSVSCLWKVPACLTDGSGVLRAGAIANIIDEIGAVAVLSDQQPAKVSVDLNYSCSSTAKLNDVIEINATVFGRKGGLSMVNVSLRKQDTGERVAEGRHILYSPVTSKL